MTDQNEDRMTSELLAAFVIDALLRVGIVQESDVKEALSVVAEELDVRHLSGEIAYA